MKINLKFVLFLLCSSLIFFSCAKQKKTLKIGMVTDSGTIDDKSFNQGTWHGIETAAKDFKLTARYVKPSAAKDADYIKEIQNLCEDGFDLIICPGFKFGYAVYKCQAKYPHVKFVILDGNAHSLDSFEAANAFNTIGISWAEHESGFLAGIASALQIKNGAFGFIGGMDISPVRRFCNGWKQGIVYANKNLGTNIRIPAENFIFLKSFSDIAAGQKAAAELFEKGVTVIHTAAGATGLGAIKQAQILRQNGKYVWVVGVDVDQYTAGLMPDGYSVILTSALKVLDKVAYLMVEKFVRGEFNGGSSIVLSAKEEAVGIPVSNPNLSAEVQAAVNDVFEKIKQGLIIVSP